MNHLITVALEKCFPFTKLAVVPELLGKLYLSQPTLQLDSRATEEQALFSNGESESELQNGRRWCYCKREEFGDMIAGDSKDCLVEWFHIECLHISRIRKGRCYCLDCHKNSRRYNAL